MIIITDQAKYYDTATKNIFISYEDVNDPDWASTGEIYATGLIPTVLYCNMYHSYSISNTNFCYADTSDSNYFYGLKRNSIALSLIVTCYFPAF